MEAALRTSSNSCVQFLDLDWLTFSLCGSKFVSCGSSLLSLALWKREGTGVVRKEVGQWKACLLDQLKFSVAEEKADIVSTESSEGCSEVSPVNF